MKYWWLGLALVISASAVAQGTAKQGGQSQQTDLGRRAEERKKADTEKMKKAEANYKASKAAYEKKPSDPKLKDAYVKATNEYANSIMMNSAYTPVEKYPPALRLYREVLKVDPKNAEARRWIETIESIYRSLGKPIPK